MVYTYFHEPSDIAIDVSLDLCPRFLGSDSLSLWNVLSDGRVFAWGILEQPDSNSVIQGGDCEHTNLL